MRRPASRRALFPFRSMFRIKNASGTRSQVICAKLKKIGRFNGPFEGAANHPSSLRRNKALKFLPHCPGTMFPSGGDNADRPYGIGEALWKVAKLRRALLGYVRADTVCLGIARALMGSDRVSARELILWGRRSRVRRKPAGVSRADHTCFLSHRAFFLQAELAFTVND